MAHFARLDESNFVTEVVVISNATIDDLPFPESEPVGVAFCQSLYGADTVWKQTSYNKNFRVNYAGINSLYLADPDMFTAPKPYPSWLLDPINYNWYPPVPRPQDGGDWMWDEATLSWVPWVPPTPNT